MDKIRLGEKKPLTVAPDDTVVHAAKDMTERRVRAATVVENGKVVGVMTVNDVMKKVVAASQNPATTRVREIMSSPALSVKVNTSVAKAAGVMRSKNVRHLVVVDDDDKLVGMLSLPYVLYELTDDLERNVGDLMSYIMVDGPGG